MLTSKQLVQTDVMVTDLAELTINAHAIIELMENQHGLMLIALEELAQSKNDYRDCLSVILKCLL